MNTNLIVLTNLAFSPPETIKFHGIVPEEISESHSTNMEQVAIQSRSSALAAYGGSNSRTTSIQFDIHEDYLIEYMGIKDITEYVAKIKALTYPRFENGAVIPPRCYLKVGSVLKLTGYPESVDITWRKPIRDGRLIWASISINFTEYVSLSYSADEIASGSDLGRSF
ncbi:contractile injection system tube protein [Listeria phage LIS04]|nr:contractile injection system tube protein [Listeria phage LIS04]